MKHTSSSVGLTKSFLKACTLALPLAFSNAVMADASTEPPKTDNNTDMTIRLLGPIDDKSATVIINKMKSLSKKDPKSDIELIINSGGGSVTAGFAIYDVMQSLPNDIKTVCEGQAASMAAFLLSSGTAGKRYSYPNCEIMFHQPSWGKNGQITDINITASAGNQMKERMIKILSQHTGWTPNILRDMMERNFYIYGDEATSMGFVDKTIEPSKPLADPVKRDKLPPSFCKKPGRSYIPSCRKDLNP